MHFNIFTLFPEMFPGNLGLSLAGKALDKKLWSYDAINIRDFADQSSVHKSVDDTPYGGGAGMVMRADVLGEAIENNSKLEGGATRKLIYPSPRGGLLTQRKIEEFSGFDELSIICGRYEGVDQRFLDKYDIEEVSIGDYIVSGGEIAAFVIIDACIRKINGVLGNSKTHEEESFAEGRYEFLLEYPLYTRPDIWCGMEVPSVLKSGDHKKINEWRLSKAKEITRLRRPDLWSSYKESGE